MFANQTASFIGIITKVDGSLLHLENSSGETGQVKISNNFSIFDLSQKNGGAAHDMNSIRLNEKVLINLEVIDGEYQANTLTYTQPNTISSPTASSSAKKL